MDKFAEKPLIRRKNMNIAETNSSENETVQEHEIEMFTNPKTVKKKTPTSVLLFQLAVCGGFLALLVFVKLTMPQVFDNVVRYITGFIAW